MTHLIFSIRQDKKASRIEANKRVGIWVDSKKAFTVSIAQNDPAFDSKPKVSLRRIDSGLEASTRLFPESVFDLRIDLMRRRKLHKYYREIIGSVQDAEKILIFGPGRAKLELEKAFRKSDRGESRVLPVEASEKITEGQIKTRVLEFFKSDLK
ncbi:MAG: hypothetical protein C4530_20050 [Desulfobacteraceae bacterium]|nr:MAG: hypothetical protein C4530_20050 [Desulfobacteraceae bacterium]